MLFVYIMGNQQSSVKIVVRIVRDKQFVDSHQSIWRVDIDEDRQSYQEQRAILNGYVMPEHMETVSPIASNGDETFSTNHFSVRDIDDFRIAVYDKLASLFIKFEAKHYTAPPQAIIQEILKIHNNHQPMRDGI